MALKIGAGGAEEFQDRLGLRRHVKVTIASQGVTSAEQRLLRTVRFIGLSKCSHGWGGLFLRMTLCSARENTSPAVRLRAYPIGVARFTLRCSTPRPIGTTV